MQHKEEITQSSKLLYSSKYLENLNQNMNLSNESEVPMSNLKNPEVN
jgi:hypothetical protein